MKNKRLAVQGNIRHKPKEQDEMVDSLRDRWFDRNGDTLYGRYCI